MGGPIARMAEGHTGQYGTAERRYFINEIRGVFFLRPHPPPLPQRGRGSGFQSHIEISKRMRYLLYLMSYLIHIQRKIIEISIFNESLFCITTHFKSHDAFRGDKILTYM